MLSALILVVGLVLLIGGADFLVNGVKGIAERFGVSPLVIGMTVVAFGTSTPEVAINVAAALDGQTRLAFGNIVGACLANIGFVLALSAMVRPLVVQHTVVSREIPMMLLAAVGIAVLALDTFLGDSTAGSLNRQDGLVLLLLFGVFAYYTALQVVAQRNEPLVPAAGERTAVRSIWIDVAMLSGGLVAVAGGGRLAVKGAVDLAVIIGIPDAVIGLTIVSFGTTLPELVTSVTAARKGMTDIAVGNVVGSCIFNILMIGGIVAVISPIGVPPRGELDLLVLVGLSAVLLPICLWGKNKISRPEAVLLFIVYAGYSVWRFVSSRGDVAI